MLRVIAVLLLIPLLDALLLVALAAWFDPLPIVLVVVLTAVLGSLLVRAEGRHTLSRIQEKLAQGELPTDELVDGGFLIAAGAFFLTPGLVTDFVGLLLAVPFTRAPIRVATKKWVITPYLEAKTDGMLSGNVYVGGFPGEEGGLGGQTPPGAGPGPGGPGSGSGPGPGGNSGDGASTDFDSENATEIDFEETDE